jgi:hypothetical protein
MQKREKKNKTERKINGKPFVFRNVIKGSILLIYSKLAVKKQNINFDHHPFPQK